VAQGTAGLVTGGGHLPSTVSGADANFGFNVHRKATGDAVTGQFEYQDKGGNLNIHSTAMNALAVSGNTATFGGTASINGKGSYSFTVTVQDYGEPAAGHDTFSISLSNGYTDHGTLSGGNINIHSATVPAPFITSITPSGGPLAGGTDVKISGPDFVKGAIVTIGGSPALGVKVVNADSITAETPPGVVGVQPVLVTNPDGQSYELSPSSLCVTCGFYYHD
jgi:hypothetical protein